MNQVRWLRLAILLVLLGLLTEAVLYAAVTPATFLLFGLVGVPALLAAVIVAPWALRRRPRTES